MRLRSVDSLHLAAAVRALRNEARRRHHRARQSASWAVDANGEDDKSSRREVNLEWHVRHRHGRKDTRRSQPGYGIISVVFTLKVYIISYIVTADGKEYAHVSLH